MHSIPFSHRIGTKLITIFFVALVPLIAVIVYLNIHMRRDALEQGRNMVFRAAVEAATAQEAMVAELRYLLRTLAETPAARSLDTAALDLEVQRLRQTHAYLINLFVCDTHGAIVASAQKPFAGATIASRGYFWEAIGKKTFVAGGFVVGQLTGTPALTFAMPVWKEDGSLAGVAAAAVNLHDFPDVFKKVEEEPGVWLAILDTRGTLLARVPPEKDATPGERLTDLWRGGFSWGQSHNSFVARGADGVETLYAYQLLRVSPEDPAPYGAIVAGLPVSVAMEAASARMYLSIGVSVGCVVVAVLLLVGLGRVTIVRRLEVLAGFAASLAAEKVCRLPPHFGRDEIGLLGRRLADMSRQLHDKSDHLAEAMASLARERDQLSVVVGQLREAREKLERLASLDFLTGLRNRRCFNEKMVRELSRLDRYGTPFSLILFDIDDFKKINDTYGHTTGDDVLRGLGRLTRDAVRSLDVAYRVGGEEFAVVLPETNGESAFVLAERLRSQVAEMAVPGPGGDGTMVHLTVSLGVAQAWAGSHGIKDVFAAADNALYAAKRAGKNRSILADGQNAA